MKGSNSSSPATEASRAVPPLADAPARGASDQSSIESRGKSGVGRADSASEPKLADVAGGSNIEQLRELVFGGQLREYERRFARMEARLAKELTEVREELRERTAALEQHMRDEFQAVTMELRSTQQSRGAEERRLSQAIADTAKGAEDRIAALSELISKETRELRIQIREQAKTLTDEGHRRYADLLSIVERDGAELREGKADRAILSALLMEVALRLRGESVIPMPEDKGTSSGD